MTINASFFYNNIKIPSNFFKKWLYFGCPTEFWLGGFQYLPAFLILILRQAADKFQKPLHHLKWKFEILDHFTEQESMAEKSIENNIIHSVTDVPSIDGTVTVSEVSTAEDSSHQVNINNTVSEQDQKERKKLSVEDAIKQKSQDKSVSEMSSWSVEKTESVNEENENLPEESEKSLETWQNLGNNGIKIKGLWLVGASWNSER